MRGGDGDCVGSPMQDAGDGFFGVVRDYAVVRWRRVWGKPRSLLSSLCEDRHMRGPHDATRLSWRGFGVRMMLYYLLLSGVQDTSAPRVTSLKLLSLFEPPVTLCSYVHDLIRSKQQ